MTIREYARGQGRLIRMITLFSIILLLILGFSIRPYMERDEPLFWLMVAMIPFVVISIAIGWATRCPRCKRSLSTVVDSMVYGFGDDDVCPYCGVSLDEPMESPANRR
jgi:hypothetical protein